ncbi:hypothetical protein [Flagellimonas myxillae]|uniref:hypothetical protein n=1 Tax=Flagellimonas myxillae TaxID=2942214 RepID=UPI00201F590B|nr:hypothetical protein [Muricauda myxillae]MCL6268158.1 hypothetical protein [Muricauda myxillae]
MDNLGRYIGLENQKRFWILDEENDAMKLTEEQLAQLNELVKDGYGGPAELAKVLDLGIEMLFYVEQEAFTQREVQQVVTALRGIIGVLRG